MNESKKQIRRLALLTRKRLSAEQVRERSSLICRRVVQTEPFRQAETVCVYIPIRNEVDTAGIIEACRTAGKRTAAPRICEGEMEFYYFSSLEDLKEGSFGILEPAGEERVQSKALIVMPGAVFDRERHRIGYGGGYYDRYLQQHPEHETIAIAYECQILDEIPFEEHDIIPRRLITENREYPS